MSLQTVGTVPVQWYLVRCDTPRCRTTTRPFFVAADAFRAARNWENEDGKHTCPACVRVKQKKQQEVVRS